MPPKFRCPLTLAAAIALCAGIAAAPSQSDASPVLNGSFETPFAGAGIRNGGQSFERLQSGPGASWNIWQSIPGWTSAFGAGIEIQSNRTLGQIDAFDGQHYVELDSNDNSSMFQDVLLNRGAHMLSFMYSPRTGNPATNGIDYALSGLFGGSVSGPGLETPLGAWTRVTQVFNVAAAGTYRLSFAASGRNDSYGGLIDAVSIAPDPAGALSEVPLPAGLVLLASAGAALLSSRYRRR